EASDAFRFEQTRSAYEDITILHAANHTAVRDGFKQFGLSNGQVAFPGALHYGSRKRMFAALLKTGYDSQKFVFLQALGGYNFDQTRFAFGESAGFVHDNDIDLFKRLQGLCIFDEDTFASAATDANHDRHGSGKAKCARACDDEYSDRIQESIGKAGLGTEQGPADEGKSGDGNDDRDEVAGNSVGQ